MRWLIYGAGNIGCLYAARLAMASENVTILARGARGAQIRERGIEIEDFTSGKRSTASVQVVEQLDPSDAYDIVLVSLPKHRIAEALPALAGSRATPSVMFFGNHVSGAGDFVAALGEERVLQGFPGAAAIPVEDRLRYIITSRREQPTTIGELDGSQSTRIAQAAAVLEAAGFPSAVSTNMDAWLKTHVAKILPTVCALFRVGGELSSLAAADDTLRLMIRAIREGFGVLKANGIPITPGNHRVFEWLPESLLLLLMRRMMRSETMAIKVGHAQGGRKEWVQLAEDFQVLVKRVDVRTPSLDTLLAHLANDEGAGLSQGAEARSEGSAA